MGLFLRSFYVGNIQSWWSDARGGRRVHEKVGSHMLAHPNDTTGTNPHLLEGKQQSCWCHKLLLQLPACRVQLCLLLSQFGCTRDSSWYLTSALLGWVCLHESLVKLSIDSELRPGPAPVEVQLLMKRAQQQRGRPLSASQG